MTDTNLDAAAPLDPSSDPSAVTRPPEREMEIVDIAVAPLPSSASSENGTAQAPSAPAAEIPVLEDVAEADADDPLATLSPAVRRLVRQYDLDVTGVQGTGPGGRLRVGDVIGMLGGRTDAATRLSEARPSATFADERPERGADDAVASNPEPATAPAAAAAPTVTVFECDMGRVLAHRKRERQSNNPEPLLTSYYVAACREALTIVPEVAAKDGPLPARLGVVLASADGEVRTSIIDADEPPLPLDLRARAFDRALRAGGKAPLDTAELLIDNYGASGSLLMTPTPLGPGRAASIGIGRARRTIVVKDGDEAPRVAAVCYITLTFLPDRIEPHRANRFLAELVRSLETWPD
jgi:pyruvate/2-oxoglutarate dehydrogenase complex dihydrolipoamide acyltransferase (E2) component